MSRQIFGQKGILMSLTNFERKIFCRLAEIPKGKITTYKFLAQAVNRPKAARAVGRALKKNPQLITIPCHRVVSTSGGISGYILGVKKKIAILKKEGIKFHPSGKIKNFKNIIYKFKN